MNVSAEEMKLLDTEALKIGAREDEAAGFSTRVVLFDSLDEVYGGRGSSANGGGDGGGGGSHGFIFSSFAVLIVVVVVGHVAESVGAVRVLDGRGRRGSVREEKEGASVRVRVSVWFERVERSSVVREEEEERW